MGIHSAAEQQAIRKRVLADAIEADEASAVRTALREESLDPNEPLLEEHLFATPLVYAACHNKCIAAAELIRLGAKPGQDCRIKDESSPDGHTLTFPLKIAVQTRNRELMLTILKEPSLLLLGQVATLYPDAIINNDAKMLALLIAANCDPEANYTNNMRGFLNDLDKAHRSDKKAKTMSIQRFKQFRSKRARTSKTLSSDTMFSLSLTEFATILGFNLLIPLINKRERFVQNLSKSLKPF